MKKIIAVLTLLLAFTVSSNAQDRKMNAEERAKMDAFEMSEYLGLKGTQQDDFVRLFEMKYHTLNDANLSTERKSEMSRIVEMKIRASITPEQMKKLEANPEMMAKLTGTKTTTAVVHEKKK